MKFARKSSHIEPLSCDPPHARVLPVCYSCATRVLLVPFSPLAASRQHRSVEPLNRTVKNLFRSRFAFEVPDYIKCIYTQLPMAGCVCACV